MQKFTTITIKKLLFYHNNAQVQILIIQFIHAHNKLCNLTINFHPLI